MSDPYEDYKRLVREIDEIISGKEGMAKQASLCDLIHPIRKMADRLKALERCAEVLSNIIDCNKEGSIDLGIKLYGYAFNALAALRKGQDEQKR